MTVSTVVPVNNYVGNSSVTTFDFDFLIENESELLVQHINSLGIQSVLVLNTDYSIHETGNPNGSYITFPLNTSAYSVLSSNEAISLSLSLDIKQESEFKTASNLDLFVLEKTFDYIVRVLQIFARKIERSIKTPEGVTPSYDQLLTTLYRIENSTYNFKNSSEAFSLLSKDWANKTDGVVQNSEYSAKYYANLAREYGGVTYSVLRASNAYLNSGEILSDTEGYNDVLSYLDNAISTGTDTLTVNNTSVSIPYSLSKTGSKIVDATYRQDVLKIYNAYGYSPYYTIDTTNHNYTLPLGEIYGMKADKYELDSTPVYYSSVILSSASLKGSTPLSLDISNILPDNNFNYEVYLSATLLTTDNADDYVDLAVYSDIMPTNIHIARLRTRTNSTVAAAGNCTLHVGSQRTIYVQRSTDYNGSCYIQMLGYRRLGKSL